MAQINEVLLKKYEDISKKYLALELRDDKWEYLNKITEETCEKIRKVKEKPNPITTKLLESLIESLIEKLEEFIKGEEKEASNIKGE